MEDDLFASHKKALNSFLRIQLQNYCKLSNPMLQSPELFTNISMADRVRLQLVVVKLQFPQQIGADCFGSYLFVLTPVHLMCL